MTELTTFAAMVLVVAGALALAVVWHAVSGRVPIPAPVVFLVAASGAAQVQAIGGVIGVRAVERVGVVALVVILFNGGMSTGWRSFRGSAREILPLGLAGTFLTGGLVALAAHVVVGFSWSIAALIGAALAPTDPAVTFSVLSRQRIVGRAETILEGESGANDPVSIALMLAVLAVVEGGAGVLPGALLDFAIDLAVGVAVGVAGGLALRRLVQRLSLPDESLYPLRALAMAGIVYAVATLAHGSGFLAVFVAGLLVGDARAPYKAAIERFHASLAGLAEVAVFFALGLTVDVTRLADDWLWLRAAVLGLLLVIVARPLAVLPLLAGSRLRRGERLFLAFSGFKGAVPILLSALAVIEGGPASRLVYDVVFAVVVLTVIGQGSLLRPVARRLGMHMREVPLAPWDLSLRLASEPTGVHRLIVRPGSSADGRPIGDLPLGDDGWVALVLRNGAPVPARGSTELEPGDDVVLLAPKDHADALGRLFEGRRSSGRSDPAR